MTGKKAVNAHSLTFITRGVTEHEAQVQKRTQPKPASAGTKRRFTFFVSDEVVEHARAAVYWTPKLNLSTLVERALQAEIARMEKDRGKPYPRRSAEE